MAQDNSDGFEEISVKTDLTESGAFCVRPWQQLGILPSGNARFCCLSTRLIRDEVGAVSIYRHDLAAIWNSASIKDVRRSMLAGAQPEECKGCYKEEEITGSSARLRINRDFTNGFLNPSKVSLENFVAENTRADGHCDILPVDLDLEMNNTCNLACRMCSPDYSSKIESDEVQSRWRPRTSKSLKPEADRWDLLPAKSDGVEYKEFGAHSTDELGVHITAIDWSRMNTVTLKPLHKLIVLCDFDEVVADWHVNVRVGETYRQTNLVPGKITEIALPDGLPAGDCRVLFRARPKNSQEGTKSAKTIPELKLYLVRLDFNADNSLTIKNGNSSDAMRSWAGRKATAAINLISQIDDVRRLQLMGGEPLLLKESSTILKQLVDSGQASKTVLSIVTNGTIWNDHFADLIGCFKTAIITISLDGIGDCLEYIREGANWSEISANIRKMNSLDNSRLSIGPTLQIYNHRSIVDLFKFAEAEQIAVRAPWLSQPRYLSIDILPSQMKAEMCTELQEYLETMPPNSAVSESHKTVLTSVIMALEEKKKMEADSASLHEFMLYTNDLDLSRGQSFAETFPDIFKSLKESGFKWHDEVRHLHSKTYFEEIKHQPDPRNIRAAMKNYLAPVIQMTRRWLS